MCVWYCVRSVCVVCVCAVCGCGGRVVCGCRSMGLYVSSVSV